MALAGWKQGAIVEHGPYPLILATGKVTMNFDEVVHNYKRKTSHTWGSVNVPSVLEKVVRLYVNEVWGKVPNVLAVVDDAYHMIPTWK